MHIDDDDELIIRSVDVLFVVLIIAFKCILNIYIILVSSSLLFVQQICHSENDVLFDAC